MAQKFSHLFLQVKNYVFLTIFISLFLLNGCLSLGDKQSLYEELDTDTIRVAVFEVGSSVDQKKHNLVAVSKIEKQLGKPFLLKRNKYIKIANRDQLYQIIEEEMLQTEMGINFSEEERFKLQAMGVDVIVVVNTVDAEVSKEHRYEDDGFKCVQKNYHVGLRVNSIRVDNSSTIVSDTFNYFDKDIACENSHYPSEDLLFDSHYLAKAIEESASIFSKRFKGLL